MIILLPPFQEPLLPQVGGIPPYGLSGKYDWAWTPEKWVSAGVWADGVGTPRSWCNAIPKQPVPFGRPYPFPCCEKSSGSRNLYWFWASERTGSPHAHAKSNHSQRCRCGISAWQCRDVLAAADGRVCIGILLRKETFWRFVLVSYLLTWWRPYFCACSADLCCPYRIHSTCEGVEWGVRCPNHR